VIIPKIREKKRKYLIKEMEENPVGDDLSPFSRRRALGMTGDNRRYKISTNKGGEKKKKEKREGEREWALLNLISSLHYFRGRVTGTPTLWSSMIT